MQRAYGLDPVEKGVFEKELLKIDERVNILNMVFSGTLLRLVPDENNVNNTWESSHGHSHDGNPNTIADKFFDNYKSALVSAKENND